MQVHDVMHVTHPDVVERGRQRAEPALVLHRRGLREGGPAVSTGASGSIVTGPAVNDVGAVERKRLVGIVTEYDVLRALAATLPCIKGADPDTYLW